MITSQLSDNGGTLGITVDGSATWILTSNANNYTGITTVGGGALGAGDDLALGGGVSTISLSNGNLFAHGGDRLFANPITAPNNTTTGFIGDYSIGFISTLVSAAAANGWPPTTTL